MRKGLELEEKGLAQWSPGVEHLDETGSSQLRGALARRRIRDATGRQAGRVHSGPGLCMLAVFGRGVPLRLLGGLD